MGSNRIENHYIQFRQIFRCAQQHVQISLDISLVGIYPSARGNDKYYADKYYFIIKDSIQKKSCLKILISDSSFIFIISHVHTNLISAISTAKSCKDFSIFSIVVFEGLRLPVT